MTIRLDGVEVGYDRSSVLHGVSITVEEGGVTSILGANGAGKTTLLRSISGILKPRAGTIRFGDADLGSLLPKDIVALGIAHVPEGRQLFPDLTVEENLRLGAYVAGRTRDESRHMERVFGYFPRLAERRVQPAGTLSGGEQQMLAIGRAMMAVPKILLLDEPSMGLAPKLVQQVLAIVLRLKREEGLGVLLVEQNARLALGLADQAYVLENGRIVMSGPAASLRSEEIVKAFYLGRSAAVTGEARP